MTERQGRRIKQLLDGRKEKRRYCNLKEEALGRTVWRTGFWRGCGPVVRQTQGWTNTLGYSTWSPFFAYHHPNLVCTSPVPHTCHMSSPSNSSWFYQPNNVCWWQISSSNLGRFSCPYFISQLLFVTARTRVVSVNKLHKPTGSGNRYLPDKIQVRTA